MNLFALRYPNLKLGFPSRHGLSMIIFSKKAGKNQNSYLLSCFCRYDLLISTLLKHCLISTLRNDSDSFSLSQSSPEYNLLSKWLAFYTMMRVNKSGIPLLFKKGKSSIRELMLFDTIFFVLTLAQTYIRYDATTSGVMDFI